MNLVAPSGISSVEWMQASFAAQKVQPLTWYKVRNKGTYRFLVHTVSIQIAIISYATCRLILMHLGEVNHWLWIWEVWARVKYGLMGRALEDIGLLLQAETAIIVIMLGHTEHQSVKLVVANQPSAGKNDQNKFFKVLWICVDGIT